MSELKEVRTENDKRESKRTVFISYSRTDSSFVKDIAKWLQEAGCTVWQDSSGLRGGETWASGIDKAVRGSDVVIVVLSPDSNASEWVRKETLLAMKLHKPIVPILFRRTEIPVQLVDLQFVDFQIDKEEAARKLLEAITNSADSQTVSYKPFRTRQFQKRLVLAIAGIFVVLLLATSIYLSRISTSSMGPLVDGVAYLQADIYSRPTNNAAECSELCASDPDCKAMTFIKSQRLCWIKNSVPGTARSSDMVSAAKVSP